MGLIQAFRKDVDQLHLGAVTDLIEELKITPEQVIDRAVIRYVFQQAAYNNIREKSALIDAEAFRDSITLGYKILNNFADDFVIGLPYERDALVMAMICNEHLMYMDLKKTREKSPLYYAGIPGLKGKLTKDLFSAAEGLWNESTDMCRLGLPKGYPVSREAHLLGHKNALQDIMELQAGKAFFDLPDEKMDEAACARATIEAIKKKRTRYASIADEETLIGQTLIKQIEWFDFATS